VTSIRATITRFVDDYQPGIVECRFTDAHNVEHIFVLKIPLVTDKELTVDSVYPVAGFIACRIVDSREPLQGRIVVIVDTAEPDGIESSAEVSRFEVFGEQLTEDPSGKYRRNVRQM